MTRKKNNHNSQANESSLEIFFPLIFDSYLSMIFLKKGKKEKDRRQFLVG